MKNITHSFIVVIVILVFKRLYNTLTNKKLKIVLALYYQNKPFRSSSYSWLLYFIEVADTATNPKWNVLMSSGQTHEDNEQV